MAKVGGKFVRLEPTRIDSSVGFSPKSQHYVSGVGHERLWTHKSFGCIAIGSLLVLETCGPSWASCRSATRGYRDRKYFRNAVAVSPRRASRYKSPSAPFGSSVFFCFVFLVNMSSTTLRGDLLKTSRGAGWPSLVAYRLRRSAHTTLLKECDHYKPATDSTPK